MTTKYIKYLFAVLVAGTSVSCSDWLRVEPEYEITDTDLFKNPQGYYQAVNGLYNQMSGLSLYGRALSWGQTDSWARCYTMDKNASTKSFYQFYALEYSSSDAVSTASSMWLNGFNVIAQANDIIAHVESTTPSFFVNGETERNLILGEALAVRAMMHFDLLRVFSPAIEVDATGKFVPYVTVYPSKFNPAIPNNEFIQLVITDLKRARDLVGKFDLTHNLMDETYRFFGNAASWGTFFSNRGIHLNYYAITGLLARAYMWAGDPDNAFTYADELIQLVTAGTFKLTQAISGDPKMLSDLMFGLYNEKLKENYEPYADDDNNYRLMVDEPGLFYTDLGTENPRKIDERGSYIDPKKYYLLKYVTAVSTQKDCVIPNLRLSEMYYIAAECTYEEDMDAATGYLNTVRLARGNTKLPEGMDKETFFAEMINEYRRDLVGEGQLIFFYKRTNRPITFSQGKFQHNGKLVVPVPDSESAM